MSLRRSGCSPKPKATSRPPPTLELLTKARELGDTVEAVYVGADADAIAPALGEYGATKVFTIDPGDALRRRRRRGAAGVELVEAEHARPRSCSRRATTAATRIARLSAKLDRPVLTNGTGL